MPIVRVQVRIPASSGVPEDLAINTFHFTAVDTVEGTRALLQDAVHDFYEALDAWKSASMTWQNATFRMYDLDDPEPRVPIDEGTLGLTATGGSQTMPRELAVCVSYHAEFVSGSSAGRRRGRIYFGPLASTASDSSGRVTSTLLTAAVTAGSGLLTASNAASDWAWVVWSPTSGQAYPVVGGWVDNEFDVQRRRGMTATVRTSF